MKSISLEPTDNYFVIHIHHIFYLEVRICERAVLFNFCNFELIRYIEDPVQVRLILRQILTEFFGLRVKIRVSGSVSFAFENGSGSFGRS